MPFWMSLHEFTSYNYEDANAFNKSESLNYNNVDMNAHWVLHVWNIPDILYYTRRSGIVSTSHWADICCFGNNTLTFLVGLTPQNTQGKRDHTNHPDVKIWYVSHVIWVCISTPPLCYMQEVWEERLPYAPVHNKQSFILFWSSPAVSCYSLARSSQCPWYAWENKRTL